MIELKPSLQNRFASVYCLEQVHGVTQRVKLMDGMISYTEKFGYAVWRPSAIPQNPADGFKANLVFVLIAQENVIDMVHTSSNAITIVVNKPLTIQTIENIVFKMSEDPMRNIQKSEELGNHYVFKDFELQIELTRPGAKVPTRANHDDAGMDVYSPEAYTIPPRGDVLIPLGVKTAFPKGFALIFKEKSGRATKMKLDIGACVLPDTIIPTNIGDFRVDQLTPEFIKANTDDIREVLVESYDVKEKKTYMCEFDGFRPSNVTECVRLTFDDGSTLECSHDHKILTTNGWKRASDLTETDEIIKR